MIKYTIIPLLLLSSCSNYVECNNCVITYWYGCYTATIRLCRGDIKCIDKNVLNCDNETKDMIGIVCDQ